MQNNFSEDYRHIQRLWIAEEVANCVVAGIHVSGTFIWAERGHQNVGSPYQVIRALSEVNAFVDIIFADGDPTFPDHAPFSVAFEVANKRGRHNVIATSIPTKLARLARFGIGPHCDDFPYGIRNVVQMTY